jgi:hypothetical protein
MFIPKRFLVVGALLLALLVGFGAGTYAGAGIDPSFTDVSSDHPFADEITWMAQHEVAGGYPDGTYRPGQPVSRQAMAAFMSRLSGAFHVVTDSTNPIASTTFELTVYCDADERPLTGSGAASASNVLVAASFPSGADGWTVGWETDDNAVVDPTSIQAWVLCAPDDLPVEV